MKTYEKIDKYLNEKKKSDEEIIQEITRILGKYGWGNARRENLVSTIDSLVGMYKKMDDGIQKIKDISFHLS